tara:strand:- start:124 stop:888 length:765 start_codon:yes stop_codon:yes gene_type:complete
MKLPRIIPVLLLDGNSLVKTRKFKSPKYVGDPLNIVKIFNEKKVDEMVILDISKSYNEPQFELIKDIAGECFIPLAYGGKIRDLDEASKIFELGFEKVILNTSFFENPNLISNIANKYGSQSVILSIDLKKNWRNKFQIYHNKFQANKKDFKITELANIAEELGAGELLVQMVHIEGTLKGPELINLDELFPNRTIPLIISGGCSNINDIQRYFSNGADAVACGHMFTFYGPHEAVLITYPDLNDLRKIRFKKT